jgi:hypothetical protein
MLSESQINDWKREDRICPWFCWWHLSRSPLSLNKVSADGIPKYIDLLEAQRKLAHANLPMSNDQLLAIASTAILASGHFPCPTNEWEALPRVNKTWAGAWKTWYRAAHIARKCQLVLAAGSSSFRTVNTITQGDTITHDTCACLDGYLDNLASAATTECTMLTQLIKTNASLTPATVATLMASVMAFTATYTLLANGKTSAMPQPTPSSQASLPKIELNPNGYCWMHSYQVKVGHNSATCTNKAEGHQLSATRANIMGGSTKGKPTTT